MNEQEQPKSNAPDFNKLELGVLEFWEQNNIFEKSLEQTKGNEPFVFYDGPPFATGLPHYGHILSSVIKDSVGRFQTMKGKYVRRVWGWDCHGLPIENIVEQLLKISGKKQIEEMGVEKFNEACRENVMKFVDEWGKTVKRIGRWVDFENSYKTMDTNFMESVWWGLGEMWKKDLVYEDRKVLLYCPRCETPISNFEVAMDNSYKEITENSVFVKFRLKPGQRLVGEKTDDSTFVLAWTTTPWTLPGNAALHIGPSIEYVLVKQGNDKYILAKDRLEILQGEYEVVKSLSPYALEGLEYEPLFPGVINNEPGTAFHIYIDDFVTTEDGAGVVHSAVMHGEEDYDAAKKHNLPRQHTLNEKGEFNSSAPIFLQGLFFKDGESPVLEFLKGTGNVYNIVPYAHSYPFCWRCGTTLYYNAIPAWFINIQSIKPKLIELNESQVNWYPDHLKQGRFAKGLENAPDWNISRNRYWATPLPFWKCNATDCTNVTCISSVKELQERSTNFFEVYPAAESGIMNQESGINSHDSIDLHRPYIDRIKLRCDKCDGEMKRIPEVVDCWLESGSMPFAELHAPFENQKEFEARQTADFVAEYIAQTRAWFYVMHVVGTAVFDHAPFKNVVTTGTILASDGSKMSKSKKNYPDPAIVIEKFGVDAIRYYLLSSPVMNGDDLNFSEMGVSDINRKLSLIFYNVWSFLRMATQEKFSFDDSKPQSDHVMDQWVLNRIDSVAFEITDRLSNYDTVRAARFLMEWVNELSTWYLRRSRERVKNDKQAQEVLAYLITQTCKLLSPFMPFISDFIFKDVTGKESVHLETWFNGDNVEDSVFEPMEIVREAVTMGHSLRKENQLSVRQPLPALVFTINKDISISDDLINVVKEELNIKSVKVEASFSGFTDGLIATGLGSVTNVFIDTKLTPELLAEGLARDVERVIQDLRKKSGLKPGQLVELFYNTQDETLENLLINSIDRKKTFVSQVTTSLEVEVDYEILTEIKGKKLWIGLLKV